MDRPFEEILARLEHLSGQFRELRDGVHKAARIAEVDSEMALTRARKVLEYVVRDVYARRMNEPPGTRNLEELLRLLVKNGHFPVRLDAYATTVKKLGNVGAHSFGEQVSVEDVYQSLTQLMPILEWYFESERPEAGALARPLTASSTSTKRRAAMDVGAAAPPIVPKGLSSYDADDADFFLELLPGPRDRAGLPESLRFWKHRIETRDEPAFTVGVIYGPSGCGKSSLVKAGLLPRLAEEIEPVYIEATAADTEARLLQGLRQRCPGLPADVGLSDAIVALRQGPGLKAGRKLLLVIDQFEQWLHAHRGADSTSLAQALRQCDGERVQGLLLVRDDFWVGLSRFMCDLHLELANGQNAALMDLFDAQHARKVLTAFGRAFRALAAPGQALTHEQEQFVSQAVAELAQDGRVICVKLALFAEMVKSKPWTPATLYAMGGVEGVGVNFLEENINSPVASFKNRRHKRAARAVLKELLPEQGADIKGNMKPDARLRDVANYASRPAEFAELLNILNRELRLITPTEEVVAGDEWRVTSAQAGDAHGPSQVSRTPAENLTATTRHPSHATHFYQLTHDYLVPSLRKWFAEELAKTRGGRAELRLGQRASAWESHRQESRHLPAWWEWLNILLWARRRDWTPVQRQMMGTAGRHHLGRGLFIVAGLAIFYVCLHFAWESFQGRRDREQILSRFQNAKSEIASLPFNAAELSRELRVLDDCHDQLKQAGHAEALVEVRAVRSRLRALVQFERLSEEATRLTTEQLFLKAIATGEKALSVLGTSLDKDLGKAEWWQVLPDQDLNEQQREQLKDKVHHLHLLLAGLWAVEVSKDLLKPIGDGAFRTSIAYLERADQSHKCLASQYLRNALDLRRDAKAWAVAFRMPVDELSIRHTDPFEDHYFMGLFHLSLEFMRDRPLVARWLFPFLSNSFLGIDFVAPFGRAEEHLRRAVHLNGRHFYAHVFLAEALLKTGKLDEAELAVAAAAALRPESETTAVLRTTIEVLRWQQTQDSDRKSQVFSRRPRFEPKDDVSDYTRGNIHFATGQTRKAIAEYNDAIKRFPTKASLFRARAGCYLATNHLDKAIGDAGLAIQYGHESAFDANFRGNVYFAHGALEKAIADYDAAIKIDAGKAVYFCNRGNAHRLQRTFPKALADADKAILLNPQCAEAFDLRGRIKHDSGDYASAVADYTRAFYLDPQDWTILQHRAAAYSQRRRQGDADKAKLDTNLATRLKSANAEAN